VRRCEARTELRFRVSHEAHSLINNVTVGFECCEASGWKRILHVKPTERGREVRTGSLRLPAHEIAASGFSAGRAESSLSRHSYYPGFFLVGAPKAGTTSMNSYLGRHPDIFMAKKELHYFSDEAFFGPPPEQRDLAWYLGEFSRAGGKRLIGESSVFYLSSKSAAERIRTFNPRAKILVHVRNPADLVVSYHSEMLYQGYEDIRDLGQALWAETPRRTGAGIPGLCPVPRVLYYSEIARLASQVEHFFAVFGRDNVLVNVFDDLASDPASVYRRTLVFLGADPSFRTRFQIENGNKTVRSQLLRSFLAKPSRPVTRAATRVLPKPIRTALRVGLRQLNTRYVPRPSAKPEIAAELRRVFEPEVERLSDLLGRDLTFWSR
jgi:hypothetical protein